MRRLIVVGLALALAAMVGCELVENLENAPYPGKGGPKKGGPSSITPAQAEKCKKLAYQARVKYHRALLKALVRKKAVALKREPSDWELAHSGIMLNEIDWDRPVRIFPLSRTKYKNRPRDSRAHQDYILRSERLIAKADRLLREFDRTIAKRLPAFCGPNAVISSYQLKGLPPVESTPVAQPAPKAKTSSGTMTQPDAPPPNPDDDESGGGG